MYEFELLFFEAGGNVGLELLTSIPGGSVIHNDSSTIVPLPAGLSGTGMPTDILFQTAPTPAANGGGGVIPAPAALPAGLILFGLMGLRRGRRTH